MGILRILLALTVCINHYLAFPMFNWQFQFGPGSRLAVEIFFVISGFYMALILDEKYTGKGACKRFYTNRILRLYPLYLLLIAVYASISVAMFVKKGRFFFASTLVDTFMAGGLLTKLWMVVANLTFIGQDATFLFSISPANGTLCLDTTDMVPAGALMLAIPQAWSVEVELMFYTFAPIFVAWRSKVLIWVVAALIAIKMYLYSLPILEFWQFRFPPAAVGLFLMGILSYRLYKRMEAYPVRPGLAWAVSVGFIGYLLVFPWVPGDYYVKSMLCYPFSFVCIPALFYLTRKNTIDRVIGELSYPIYLAHSLVIIFVFYYIGTQIISVFYALCITIGVSYALHRYVQTPIERYRQARSR